MKGGIIDRLRGVGEWNAPFGTDMRFCGGIAVGDGAEGRVVSWGSWPSGVGGRPGICWLKGSEWAMEDIVSC